MDTSLEATEVGVKSSSTSSRQESMSHVHVKLASHASHARMPRLSIDEAAAHIVIPDERVVISTRENIGCFRVGSGRVAANRVRA